MKKIHLLPVLIIVLFSCNKSPKSFHIENLKCEYLENPMGIEVGNPRLTWQVTPSESNASQKTYQIIAGTDSIEVSVGNGNFWDSGKISSIQSINVPFKGKSPESGKKYFWKVRIWNEKDQVSLWSEIASWRMDLLSVSDWDGSQWIAYEKLDSALRLVPGVHGKGDNLGEKAVKRPVVPLFRKSFNIDKKLVSAVVSVSGLGHYEAYINGEKVGDSFLTPGWTNYDKTVLYNSYDVTSMLKNGENVLGAIVGNGFYNINRERYRKLVIAYGMPVMTGHLQLNFADGSSETIVTDQSWKTAPSPITYTSIYGGEDYDATLEQPDWNKAGFDDSVWKPVLISDGPSGKLSSELDYPVKVMTTIPVKKITPLKDGSFLYDIAPEYVEFDGGFRNSPEWGSAGVILPYLLYKWYGDTQIIDEAWPMMMKYISYLENKSNNHLLNYGLGEDKKLINS